MRKPFPESDRREQPSSPCPAHTPRPAQRQCGFDVLERGELAEQSEVLEHEPDDIASVPRIALRSRSARSVSPTTTEPPCGRSRPPRTEQCRFARTRRSGDCGRRSRQGCRHRGDRVQAADRPACRSGTRADADAGHGSTVSPHKPRNRETNESDAMNQIARRYVRRVDAAPSNVAPHGARSRVGDSNNRVISIACCCSHRTSTTRLFRARVVRESGSDSCHDVSRQSCRGCRSLNEHDQACGFQPGDDTMAIRREEDERAMAAVAATPRSARVLPELAPTPRGSDRDSGRRGRGRTGCGARGRSRHVSSRRSRVVACRPSSVARDCTRRPGRGSDRGWFFYSDLPYEYIPGVLGARFSPGSTRPALPRRPRRCRSSPTSARSGAPSSSTKRSSRRWTRRGAYATEWRVAARPTGRLRRRSRRARPSSSSARRAALRTRVAWPRLLEPVVTNGSTRSAPVARRSRRQSCVIPTPLVAIVCRAAGCSMTCFDG